MSAIWLATTYVNRLVLSAWVWNGGEDVTGAIQASRFAWTRKSADPTGDAQWNAAHNGVKQVELTTMDVQYSAAFDCSIMD